MKEQHVIETAREADTSIALVVTGMHRSGTSAVTRVISLLGAALPRHLMTPQADNPKGFWESDLVVALNDELLSGLGSSWDDALSFLLRRDALASDEKALQRMRGAIAMDFGGASPVVMKDPRVSILLDPWLTALQRSHYAPRVIIVVRDPLEVASSLAARNSFSTGRSLLLWLSYFLAAERSSRGVPRVFIHYDDLINDWRAVMRRVQTSINAPFSRWSPAVELEVDAFVSARERHHHVPADLISQRSDVMSWVKETYERARAAASGGEIDSEALDRVAADYSASLTTFAPLIAEHQVSARLAQHRQAELSASLAAAERGNADRTAHIADLEGRLVEAEAAQRRAESAQAEVQAASQVQFSALISQHEEQLGAARVEHEAQLSALTRELEAMSARLGELDAEAARHREALRRQEQDAASHIRMRDARIGTLEAGVHRERGRVSVLEAQLRDKLSEFDTQRGELEARLSEKDAEISDLRGIAGDRGDALEREQAAAAQLRADIDARDVTTRALLDSTHRAYQQSTSWKFSAPIRLLGAIARRVRLLGANVSTITQQTGGVARTVERVQTVLKQEGVAGLARRVENVVNRAAAVEASPVNSQLGILEANRPLEVIAAEWKTQHTNLPELTREHLVREISAASKSAIFVSLTHDNYTKNFGGIQLCAQIEEANARASGQAYVNLHPVQPLPILAEQNAAFRFAVVLNGKPLGAASAQVLSGAISDLHSADRATTMIVHSLLGHAPEAAAELARACGDGSVYFWLHDYLSVCPSYNLLRNNLVFCGAPPIGSNACGVCLHGARRQVHVERLKAFLQLPNVVMLSPSDYALGLWRKALAIRAKGVVVPHVEFASQPTRVRQVAAGETIRIGYLGLPSHHKGWSAFARLVTEFGGDPRFQFYHFGQMNSGLANVKFVPVKVSADNLAAMTEAIAEHRIDAAFIWSMWPETFCFTMYEALAGGAWVISNPNSGNVQDTIKKTGEGVVLEDEAALIQYCASGALQERVTTQRTQGRKERALTYSEMSFAPQAREAAQ